MTDCSTCRLLKGDCGHHHINSDNQINFNIPMESHTNKYGDCCYYIIDVETFSMQQITRIKDRKNKMYDDIEKQITYWFSMLKHEGVEPWEYDLAVQVAEEYGYTKEKYNEILKRVK